MAEVDIIPATAPAFDMVAITLLIHDARLTNYLMTMALGLLLFDYFISLREEVELIWKRRMRFTSYLYLWNRYVSLIGIIVSASFVLREMTNDEECRRYLQMEGAFSTTITVTVDIVLVYRIWILYAKSNVILYFLSFLVICEFIVVNTLVIKTLNSIGAFLHLGHVLTGCYPAASLPDYFKYYVVTMLLISVVMFLLTAYKCAEALIRYKFHGMPVIRLFLRDGLYWFVAVLAFTIAQTAVLTTARVTLAEMMIAPTVAIYGTIGSRVVLNIRGMLFNTSDNDYEPEDAPGNIELIENVSRIRVRNRPDSLFEDEDDDTGDSVGTRISEISQERDVEKDVRVVGSEGARMC